MKKKLVPIAVVAGLVAIVGAMYAVQPDRMTLEQIRQASEAQGKLDGIDTQKQALETEEQKAQPPAETKIPGVFKVKFECSNGNFVVECHQDWAPLGVERFKTLVQDGFFNDARFFRVVTRPQPFVVQFGIAGDPAANLKWGQAAIKDDPVKQSNTPGTITFAMAGPNTRTTQLFINLGDNSSSLDSQGFAAFGKVIEGMDVVKAFNDRYQGKPLAYTSQYMAQGNVLIDKEFPGLDYIKTATIIE